MLEVRAPMTDLQQAFESFWDHAPVAHPGPQRQADQAWRVLREALTKDQRSTILSAKGHCHEDSCSRREFDTEMEKLGKQLGFR